MSDDTPTRDDMIASLLTAADRVEYRMIQGAGYAGDFRAAADTIAALRADVQRLTETAEANAQAAAGYADDLAAARQRIAELKAALEAIHKRADTISDRGEVACRSQIRTMARNALEAPDV